MIRMTGRTWAMLILLSVLWGGSFLFVGVAVAELPPLTIVGLRVGIAALTLWGVLALTGRDLPRGWPVWRAFFGMGLLNNVLPFTLIVWGQTQIASGLASILNAMTPIFTVVVAHWLTADEKLTRAKLLGVALGFGGVAVMIGLDALAGLGVAILAQLAVLGAAISYAFAGVYGRRFRAMGVEPLATAAGQVTAATLLLAPIALLVETPWALPMPGAATLLSVFGLAILSTAMAYVLFFRILAVAGATNLLLVTFLIPPSAILMGWAVLGEALAAQHFLGLALILAGLAAIDGRLQRRATGGER